MIKPRYSLIANLDYVVIGGVRTYTHALLVERGDSLFSPGWSGSTHRAIRRA